MAQLLVDVICGCGIVLSIAITIASILAFIYLFKNLLDL